MTTLLCHYCEFDVTDGRNHDCPYIGIPELQKNVADAAINALCGCGSITSECRRDAAALVLAFARWAKVNVLNRSYATEQLEKAYRHFEFGEPLPVWLRDCLDKYNPLQPECCCGIDNNPTGLLPRLDTVCPKHDEEVRIPANSAR